METKKLKFSMKCSRGLENFALRIKKAITAPCRLINRYTSDKIDKTDKFSESKLFE